MAQSNVGLALGCCGGVAWQRDEPHALDFEAPPSIGAYRWYRRPYCGEKNAPCRLYIDEKDWSLLSD